MKFSKALFLFIIIVSLIFCSVYQQRYFRKVSGLMIPLAEQLSANILLEDHEQTAQTLHDLRALWREHRTPLYALIEHEYISDIDLSLASLSADLTAKNYQQLHAEAARLTEYLHALAKTERITLSNVF